MKNKRYGEIQFANTTVRVEKGEIFTVLCNGLERGDIMNVGDFICVISRLLGKNFHCSKLHVGVLALSLRKAFRNNDFCLASVDVDDLTKIDDKFGHLCGTIVCYVIAVAIAVNIKKQGGVLCLGGEENLFVLPLEIKDSLLLVNKILEDIKEFEFVCRGCKFKISVTVGLVHYREKRISSFVEMVDDANKVLYRGKKIIKGHSYVSLGHGSFLIRSKININEIDPSIFI